MSQVGVEIAEPLTAALERIHVLTATGKIDRAGLRALRDEVEQARQAGMIGQQLTRFASGRVRQSHEVLQLEEVLKSVLSLRTRETQARGIALKHELKSARVIVDGSLLFSLLNATLDWALANAHAHIAFTVDFKTWPVHARLTCRFANRPADQVDESVTTEISPRLDSLTWRLIEQTAWTMGLVVEPQGRRRHDDARARVSEDGRRRDGRPLGDRDRRRRPAIEQLEGARRQPRARRRVAPRGARADPRRAAQHEHAGRLRRLDRRGGELLQGRPAARDHRRLDPEGQPLHRTSATRSLAEVPDFVFIEILEQGSTFEMSGTNGAQMARIGRDVVASSLPAALMFELSRGL